MIAAAAPPTSTEVIPHPLGNVLVAEDDPELRDLLSCFLRRRGYRVFCVRDGGALLHRINESGPRGPLPGIDVIVSDVYMPCTDGLEALKELRDADQRIPVILMTAFGSDQLHQLGLQRGATAVLDKPFDLEDLLAAVDEARFGRTR